MKVVFCQPRSNPEIVISRIEVLHSQKYLTILEMILRNAGDNRKPQRSEVSRMPPSIHSKDEKKGSIIRGRVIPFFRRMLSMITIYHMSKTQSQSFRGFHGFQMIQVLMDPDSF